MSSSTNQHSNINEQKPAILALPPELLQHILTYLPPQSLVSLRHSCRAFHAHATRESLWVDLLRQQLTKHDLPLTPSPAKSFSELYLTQHPYWFLLRHRVWFSNKGIHRGRLMVTKFAPEGSINEGSILGYTVVGHVQSLLAESWQLKPNVIIHLGRPEVGLDTEDVELEIPFYLGRLRAKGSWSPADEMRLVPRTDRIFESYLALARDLPAETAKAPGVLVWPPRTIPNLPRTRSSEQGNSPSSFTAKGHRPETIDDISQTNFRLRRTYRSIRPMLSQMTEDVSTWSAIPLELLLPTKQKPYQGLFVGDYATHGCEFLLVMQTERAPARPSTPIGGGARNHFREMLARYHANADDDLQESIYRDGVTPNISDEDGTIHKGALEAVKITGDENVPRGEHTFIADDIGRGGFIRVAHEAPFRGARVVKSRGHIADTGFQGDQWLDSELFLINGNTLAQYWKLFRHISYYHRVDLESLLTT